ncbi:hypothetical protein [Desulfurispira natronophila]|uniref:Uncharacterized protein n=1 Tax=Desulfurispira natronophila TaxID=682562 RepID=A0A7W8DGK4_9BACT|nr:hypothetical protein [Desulfurispira natronophila]MBB5021467.1 hypothetical protein [Desulfurispira natronophila]
MTTTFSRITVRLFVIIIIASAVAWGEETTCPPVDHFALNPQLLIYLDAFEHPVVPVRYYDGGRYHLDPGATARLDGEIQAGYHNSCDSYRLVSGNLTINGQSLNDVTGAFVYGNYQHQGDPSQSVRVELSHESGDISVGLRDENGIEGNGIVWLSQVYPARARLYSVAVRMLPDEGRSEIGIMPMQVEYLSNGQWLPANDDPLSLHRQHPEAFDVSDIKIEALGDMESDQEQYVKLAIDSTLYKQGELLLEVSYEGPMKHGVFKLTLPGDKGPQHLHRNGEVSAYFEFGVSPEMYPLVDHRRLP